MRQWLPGHVVLVGDVYRERDADGIAHLIDDEGRDFQRGEAAVARSVEGCVRSNQREHMLGRRVAVPSDGGLPWLAAAEEDVGICRALAACMPKWRRIGTKRRA